MDKRSLRALAISLGASAAAATLGSIGSRDAPRVYARLEKPRWAPPAQVFGPVWTALYAAMGVAAWRAWRTGQRAPLVLHGAQLALNAAWPAAFFSAGRRRGALAILLALDAAVAAEIAAVRRDRLAVALLAPYLAWDLYATALNSRVSDPGDAA